MLVTTHGHSGLGQVTATPAEEAFGAVLTERVITLADRENDLRRTFAQLLPDLTALQIAGKDVPPALLALLQQYNTAQATFMEAANIWLQARANTPVSDLPDPGAQAIAIPTFDIQTTPTSGFGLFGAPSVPAANIRIRYGIVGREMTSPLSDYTASYGFGYPTANGLGLGPVGWAVIVLLGLAIVAATVILTARSLSTSDTAAANNAITAQAGARIQEVRSDRDLFVSTRDSCIGSTTDTTTRLQCINAAADVLRLAKEGRPSITKPISPTTVGIVTAVGVIAVLGVAGTIGYVVYKRRQGGSDLPRATARPRRRHDDYDNDMDDEMY